jgi:hypothetical protein
MKPKKIRKQAYHCDGYYFNGACQFRGVTDVADDNQRSLCMNYGLNEKDKLCRHCVENRKWFRAEPRKLNGKVISLTPFHAKNSEAITVLAWEKQEPMIEFLKGHPSLYGVNVLTGDIIDAPIVVV